MKLTQTNVIQAIDELNDDAIRTVFKHYDSQYRVSKHYKPTDKAYEFQDIWDMVGEYFLIVKGLRYTRVVEIVEDIKSGTMPVVPDFTNWFVTAQGYK